MSFAGSKYRSDIDGLRAVAVLAVVFYHAFPKLLPGGFVGVDVFFVISGFLITGIILKEHGVGRFSFGEFYARRIKRLFPSLCVVLLCSLIAGWFLLFPDEYKQLGKHVFAGAGFGSNLLLWRETGYFDTDAESKPLLHLWSLGIEEQFYLIWPLLLGLVLWRGWRPLHVLLLVLVSSFFISLKLTGSASAFFLPFCRFWELLLGAGLACVTATDGGFKLSAPMARAASWLGLALLIAGITLITPTTPFPGVWALLPVGGTFLLIAAGADGDVNRLVLSQRPLVGVGLISYPVYLWHWPLLAFARVFHSGTPSVALRVALVLISFVLAYATYRWVEKPLRFGSGSRRIPLLLCAALAAIAIAGLGIKQLRGVPARYAADAEILADLTYDHEQLPYHPCDPKLASADPRLTYCFQSAAAPPTMAVFGDSHGDHTFVGIASIDTKRSWLMAGHPSCPPLAGVNVKVDQDGCQQRSEYALEFLASSTSIHTVVLAYFGSYILDTDYAAEHLVNHMGPAAARITSSTGAGSKPDLFYQGLDRVVSTLETAGKRVIVFYDVPELPFVPRACIPRRSMIESAQPGCAIDRASALARQQQPRELIARLAAAHPRLLVFDPLAVLCMPTGMCPIKRGNTLIYRDSHHLSLRGSQYVARSFIDWLATVP